ncbi:MAG: SufD family Fe-S cluster assembly protein [Lachnospiraceae bacterium]|uniref:SufD family Fe-S cluster assembly protein n=1 Tax=Candidatus Weimeria bifida TaxID=2599074 RepID=A0A6N7IXC5_9FIRM|nr:SufD family Fe-S cluster assembly protein [Candidatus Weimeria bifida]RRF97227.1 MAG: SufD family Fe-S cluster assembly protein [Lachnospiraceae bacterium]
MSDLKLNVLPSPTWNWLRMNDTNYQMKSADGYASPSSIVTASGVSENDGIFPADFDGGVGHDFSKALDQTNKSAEVFDINADTTDPLKIAFKYDDDSTLANRFVINLAENKKATVIMNFEAEKSAGQYSSQVAANIAKGAELTVVQIMRFSHEATFLNDIGTEIDDKGKFNLVQIVLGGKNVFLGVKNHMSGAGSAIDMKLGYYMTGDDNLDVNYVASHTGKRTLSDIYVNGVLRDRAQKTFRGTIDLIKGCKGAKGNELEDVLLMDKPVRNKTIPVILCAEEDVEGNHGATIGKLAKDLLFYLESRGMSREAVYEMMARARIDAIASNISDEDTKKRVGEYLDEFRR